MLRLRVGLLVVPLLGTGCGRTSERPSAEKTVDSIIAQGQGVDQAELRETLDPAEKERLLERAADPDVVVADFLRRLPRDSVSVPLTPEERGDTVFRYFRDTTLFETSTAFVWGELAAGTVDTATAALVVPCRAGTGCLGKASQASPNERLSRPDLIAVPRPKVEAFLNAPLRVAGYPHAIREVTHPDAQDRIARAVCVRNVPTIQYAPNVDARYSPISFAFVRAHEYGHWLKAHVSCATIQPPPSAGFPPVDQRELGADCEAARVLTQAIPVGGVGVVVVAAERFGSLNWPSRDGYPPTRVRRERLYSAECEYRAGT